MQTKLMQSNKRYTERVRKSAFVRYFDKTPPGIVCPHFWICAWANGCPHECQYCFLQLTFRGKVKPQVFSNRSQLRKELVEWIEKTKTPGVMNTGELCDSLALDDQAKFSEFIIPIFERQRRHKVLFLTKSNRVENLVKMGAQKQSIVSFSLNPSEVARRYELKSASPHERIKAAKAVYDCGYETRLRIDPILPIENWKEHYSELVDQIFDELKPSRITLGTLRHFKGLRVYANKLGRDTSVFDYATETDGTDHRRRTSNRADIYSFIIEKLHEIGYYDIALCKETQGMWDILQTKYKLAWGKCNCTL